MNVFEGCLYTISHSLPLLGGGIWNSTLWPVTLPEKILWPQLWCWQWMHDMFLLCDNLVLGAECLADWNRSLSRSVMSDSLQPHELYSPRNSLGQNIGLGSLSIFQGIFPTQGLNPGLPHCRWILYQLSHRGIPRILEWVACPFSWRSSPHTNWTGISRIAGRFCTNSGKPWKKGYQGNPDGRRQHWLSVLVIV